MEESYRTTLEDFKVALMICAPFDWESRSFYEQQIKFYEEKLEELEKTEG